MATNSTVLDDKARIEASIKAFQSGSIAKNGVKLFEALGYSSERAEALEPNTAEGLLELVNRSDFFNRRKADPDEWHSIDLLFQLTDEEVRNIGQPGFDFDSKQLDMDSDRRFYSYLLFAVQLKRDSYNRTTLADITREINRFFDMPALVLFKHGRTLTLSVINRRLRKRDSGHDVLEKVTLIKDIRIENPHRAHVEILFDLAFPQLIAEHRVTNFVELHDAWRKTLDISELNKRFYKDLANWYFWALEQVRFPTQPGVADEVNRATNIIRLITRLTFVWFLKERQLVPDDLFRRESLEEALLDLSPKSSTFYKAILQNLFFATLNTPMDDPANPREFRKETEEGRRFNDQYMVHNQYRHKKLFRNPETALGIFASVPFLNGGLFECLDKREEVNGKLVETRLDGFSDVEKKQPVVPNRLFFCEEHSCADDNIDLNAVYGTRNRQYRVRGLIDTLNRYKFTIAENTPIDEEVALDPELLGKVFENLLASYNPETGATARKQTGSFYTPREIVNYMVDESLIAYLETRLPSANSNGQAKSGLISKRDAQASFIGQQPLVVTEAAARADDSDGESLNSRLHQLFAYTHEPHGFTEGEVASLIKAIDEVKILDPACGSGAFPMGILGKLVFILSKLDPQNARWKQRQIDRVREAMRAAEKIEDDKFRESTLQDLQAQIGSIEEAFRNNELDYGRKLFLIENCIYGVDIQPIAIQISKLRFFISLIIDQRIRPQAENLGIRPLPNLETKFVAANTLLGIEKPAQSMLQNEELRRAIEEKERELKIVRERHFTARTTRTKEKYRKEDERLRREIGKLLEEDNWSPETTAKLIKWNPYEQNGTAEFFDAEWMFGVIDGFNIVIGNPPYSSKQSLETKRYREFFSLVEYKCDPYAFFIEQGLRSLKKGGVLGFIVPVTWMTNYYYMKLRQALIQTRSLKGVALIDGLVFESANVDNSLLFLSKESVSKESFSWVRTTPTLSYLHETERSYQSIKNEERFDIVPDVDADWLKVKEKLESKSERLSAVGKISLGMKLQRNDLFVSSTKDKKHPDPIYFGSDISRYGYLKPSAFFDFDSAVIVGGTKKKAVHKAKPKILIQAIRNLSLERRIVATLDSNGDYFIGTVNGLVITDKRLDIKYVLGLLNSALLNTYFRKRFTTISLTAAFLGVLPIRVVKAEKQAPIIKLVDEIITAKRKDSSADTSELERRIERLVYRLYELTPEEIAIVEASRREEV